MSFLSRLFGRKKDDDDDGEEVVINLDLDKRRQQLKRLEDALDTLATQMRSEQSTDNPGWRGRVNEYTRLAGEAMMQRQGRPTRESLLDLVFEVRPVFTGSPPEGLAGLVPLQDEVMAAAEDLRELLPGERA
jgi:hypothetical protein